MKTLTIALILIASFTGCKKCADCTTTYTYTGSLGAQQSPTVIDYDVCGDDLKEMDGSKQVTTYYKPDGSVDFQMTETTTCN